MEHLEYNTKIRQGKHLNYEERIKIEILYNERLSAKEISIRLGRSKRTIEREIKSGYMTLLNSDLITRHMLHYKI